MVPRRPGAGARTRASSSTHSIRIHFCTLDVQQTNITRECDRTRAERERAGGSVARAGVPLICMHTHLPHMRQMGWRGGGGLAWASWLWVTCGRWWWCGGGGGGGGRHRLRSSPFDLSGHWCSRKCRECQVGRVQPWRWCFVSSFLSSRVPMPFWMDFGCGKGEECGVRVCVGVGGGPWAWGERSRQRRDCGSGVPGC